jgi:hypothetical protein
VREKRRLISMRSTLSRPQDVQIETALADHAVLKLILGPTCFIFKMEGRKWGVSLDCFYFEINIGSFDTSVPFI